MIPKEKVELNLYNFVSTNGLKQIIDIILLMNKNEK